MTQLINLTVTPEQYNLMLEVITDRMEVSSDYMKNAEPEVQKYEESVNSILPEVIDILKTGAESTESTAEGQFGTPEMAERWKRVYYGHLASGNSLWDLLESLVDEKTIWDFYVKVQRDMATDKDVLQWVLDWESTGDEVKAVSGKCLYG